MKFEVGKTYLARDGRAARLLARLNRTGFQLIWAYENTDSDGQWEDLGETDEQGIHDPEEEEPHDDDIVSDVPMIQFAVKRRWAVIHDYKLKDGPRLHMLHGRFATEEEALGHPTAKSEFSVGVVELPCVLFEQINE